MLPMTVEACHKEIKRQHTKIVALDHVVDELMELISGLYKGESKALEEARRMLEE